MLLVYVIAVSALCFGIFAWDKYCAIRGFRRIPEKTLLILAAIGGTPGAFAGQKLLRHKTQKQPFGIYLMLIAISQALLLAVLAFMTGGTAIVLMLLI